MTFGLVDPSGKEMPVNFTNGYGVKHHLKLRLVYTSENRVSEGIFKNGQTLLITAFSPVNKNNGFYQKTLGANGDPELLKMGQYTIFCQMSQLPHYMLFDRGMPPVKAGEANAWIVKMQSSSEAPNFYVTNDFKIYKRLTNFQPQLKYNWLTSLETCHPGNNLTGHSLRGSYINLKILIQTGSTHSYSTTLSAVITSTIRISRS